MNSIHRVKVDVTEYQEIDLTGPPLSVAADRSGASDTIDLWFEHYDAPIFRPFPIYIFGTGHPVPWNWLDTRDRYRFIGTVVTPASLVWHVYTGPRKTPIA